MQAGSAIFYGSFTAPKISPNVEVTVASDLTGETRNLAYPQNRLFVTDRAQSLRTLLRRVDCLACHPG